MKKSIIWLASYPKSGNTWFRSFVSALRKNSEFSINNLDTDGIYSGKNIMEKILDLCADDLSDEQIFKFQPIAWNYFAQISKKELLIKIHDAIEYRNGVINIPLESSLKAIYFVRNPFDIAPSLSNHQGTTLEEVVQFLCDNEAYFVKLNQSSKKQFKQSLFTWQMHIQSWQSINDFPILFLRYEDMLNSPFKTFKKAVNFLNWEYSDDEIQNAIRLCSFDKLREQESKFGFQEKNVKSERFFNKGIAGYGQQLLSKEQQEAIRNVNGKMMNYFNYQ